MAKSSGTGGVVKGQKRGTATPGDTVGGPAIETDARKWLRMAGAMDAALERMRNIYALVSDYQKRGVVMGFPNQGFVAGKPENWQPFLDEVAAAANILKSGLKAREPR